tara:strand:- start:20 stop:871 length:852 start_codon:yes stop_codon:yes gene_type:complete
MQNIEDDKSLDFQTELLMLLSQESNIEDNLCLISNLQLEENHIKLCCGHKFNYASIFNEVMNQKKSYNHLETQRLSTNEIKCPYCRTVQKGLLPSRDNYDNIYGVNWPKKYQYKANVCSYVFASGKKKGLTCGKKCFGKYCESHEKISLKREQKKLLKQKKLLEEETEKLQKILDLNMKLAKKELPTSVVNMVNTIISNPQTTPQPLTCSYIFKRGKNKGKNCQCKKIYNNGLCKLHYNQYLKKIKNQSAKETKMKILLTAVNTKGPKIKNVSIQGNKTIITV